MNKIAIGLIAIVALIGTPALAADMAVKAPSAPQAPVYSWTGWYVGGNVGYGWGSANDNISFLQSQAGGGGGGGPPFAGFAASDRNRTNGVIGGVQAGYNWQFQNYLAGFEADIQGSGQKGSMTYSSTIIDSAAGPNAATVTATDKIEWFGTVRARVGVTSDRWLVYGTGGLAYGEVKINGNVLPAASLPFPLIPTPGALAWNGSTTRAGWTLGAGVENALMSSDWTWKIEYLYIDLGKTSANVSGGVGNCYGPVGGPCNGPLGTPAFGSVTSRITDNIIRLGLNYKFH